MASLLPFTPRTAALTAFLCAASACSAANAQPAQNDGQILPPEKSKQTHGRQTTQAAPTPQEELQKAIEDAANDRAALVRNLEAYLQKYPETPQKPQIYRALVEASLQVL